MTVWIVEAALVGLFALACGALAAAWTRNRLGIAAVLLLLIALAGWIGSFAAMATESRDASSSATCAADCSASAYVLATAFLAPPLLIALAGLGILVARGSRWRSRRDPARENHA